MKQRWLLVKNAELHSYMLMFKKWYLRFSENKLLHLILAQVLGHLCNHHFLTMSWNQPVVESLACPCPSQPVFSPHRPSNYLTPIEETSFTRARETCKVVKKDDVREMYITWSWKIKLKGNHWRKPASIEKNISNSLTVCFLIFEFPIWSSTYRILLLIVFGRSWNSTASKWMLQPKEWKPVAESTLLMWSGTWSEKLAGWCLALSI